MLPCLGAQWLLAKHVPAQSTAGKAEERQVETGNARPSAPMCLPLQQAEKRIHSRQDLKIPPHPNFNLYLDQQSLLSWLRPILVLHQTAPLGQAEHNCIFLLGYKTGL